MARADCKDTFFAERMTKLGVLEKIELELKQELARLGDCSAVIALGPHRTAFDKILKEVRSIKPILIKV